MLPLDKIEQGSSEWLHQRCGKVTASRVADVMAVNKDGRPSERRKGYMIQIVCERLTGFAGSSFVTDAMSHGIEMEPLARAQYEIRTNNEVDIVGMAVHPRIPFFSASPDGCIGKDGLWEAKCPTTPKHVSWMINGEVPAEHRDQMFAQMSCWERQWNEFTSFDPRLPERHQLFIKRLHRDEKRIAEIEAAVIQFLAEVDETIARLEALNPAKGPTQKLRDELEESLRIQDTDIEGWYADHNMAHG